MKEINKVLICGLGAIGGFYATKFHDSDLALKILVDKARYEKYTKTPRIINNELYKFEYVLPNNKDFCADLIIIATKSDGLDDAIKNIKNFVGENTIILSFLNGITSERKIKDKYGDKVLYSYLLGHTFFRKDNSINHDGQATIHFGSDKGLTDERIGLLANTFDKINVGYKVDENIIESLWKKFCFNCCANQISALTRMTFGEMKSSEKCLNLMKDICNEVTLIAQKEGISNVDFYKSTLDSLDLMIPNGKTSMLQDVESGKKPEVDIFGCTIVSLGTKYGIDTPYNKIISEILESLNFPTN